MNQGHAGEVRFVEGGSAHIADQNEKMLAVFVVGIQTTTSLIPTDLGPGEVCPDEGSLQAGELLRSAEGPLRIIDWFLDDFQHIPSASKTIG